MAPGYSGAGVIELAEELLAKAFRGVYPITWDSWKVIAEFGGPREFRAADEVIELLETMIADLEMRLDQPA